MRPIILMIAAMIMACCPKSALAVDDDINDGNDRYDYVKTYSWKGFLYGSTVPIDFKGNEKYRIDMIEYNTDIITVTSLDIIMSSSVKHIESWEEFIFPDEPASFRISYVNVMGGPNGQAHIKFSVNRMQFGNWQHKSDFHMYVTTSCPTDENLAYGTLAGVDHEVGGILSVYVPAVPNGGSTELDGGNAVILYPGFSTNLSGGGEVLAIIDGCGGAYRMASTSETTVSETPEAAAALGKEIQVYPNPVTDKFKINFPAEMEGKELNVEVMDINGRILYSHKETTKANTDVDLSGFQTGMYFINISGEGVNYNQKLIKQ